MKRDVLFSAQPAVGDKLVAYFCAEIYELKGLKGGDKASKKLKRGKGSLDGCVAEVYRTLPPSAGDVLMLGLQDHFQTLSFLTEWTEITAALFPKCVGPRGLKDYRPLASPSAIRKLSGYV